MIATSDTTPSMYGPPEPFGFQTADGRRGGFCAEGRPRCVHGHALKTRDPETLRNLMQETIATCVHQERSGAPPCGARLYVGVVQVGGSAQIRDEGERVLFICEVTGAHIKRMRKEPMIFLERLSLFRCVLPGVDFDLLGARPGANEDDR